VQHSAAEAEPQGRGTRFRSGYLRRAPGIIATISTLLGLLTLVGALDPNERFRVHAITRVIPVPASAAATAVGTVAGLLLLRLAAALRKRKKRAWRAAVAIAAIMMVTHVVRGVRVVEAVFSVVLLVLLITARSRYTAKSDPRSRWFAALVFCQFTLVAIGYGLLLLWTYRSKVVGHPSFWSQL
jgi:lysyl-tRNA synthetase class 2